MFKLLSALNPFGAANRRGNRADCSHLRFAVAGHPLQVISRTRAPKPLLVGSTLENAMRLSKPFVFEIENRTNNERIRNNLVTSLW